MCVHDYNLRFDTPFDGGSEHRGKKCRMIREAPHEDFDYEEVGPLYEVEFEDETIFTAYPEELFKDGVCIEPETMFLNRKVMWNPEVFTEEEQKKAKEVYDSFDQESDSSNSGV
jgi:hypothetical protein